MTGTDATRTDTTGKRLPYGLPSSGCGLAGPVVPWHPPRTLAHTTNQRSVSIGLPGPIRPFHQPGVGCPGASGPHAWLSPVSAWQTRIAFDARSSSVPHVSYAMVRSRRTAPPSRAKERSPKHRNRRSPAGSPGSHAPDARSPAGRAVTPSSCLPRRCGGSGHPLDGRGPNTWLPPGSGATSPHSRAGEHLGCPSQVAGPGARPEPLVMTASR